MRYIKSIFIGLLGVWLVGCATVQTTGRGAVGVDRGQMMLVSAQEIENASAKQYQEVLAEARKQNLLNRDRAQFNRVLKITQRLIPQTAAFRPDAPRWQWEINVLKSDSLNAWCMAGGKMMIYSGLIDRLRLSDDEIAAVLGHEMAHALREHSREQVSRSVATGMGVSVAGALLGVGDVGQDLMSTVARVTFELPHSRLHEIEADRIGVELAARAGYDPRAAISLFSKMSTGGGASPPQWLSTHPTHATRQRELTEMSQRVMPLYQAASR